MTRTLFVVLLDVLLGWLRLSWTQVSSRKRTANGTRHTRAPEYDNEHEHIYKGRRQKKAAALLIVVQTTSPLLVAAFAILAMYYFGVSQGRFGDLEQNPNIFPNIPFDGSSLARQNHNRLKQNYYQLSVDDSETPVIIPSFERARTLRLWPSLRPIWKFRQCDKILTSNTTLCSSLSLETINHS